MPKQKINLTSLPGKKQAKNVTSKDINTKLVGENSINVNPKDIDTKLVGENKIQNFNTKNINKRTLGHHYECLAAEYLQKNGLTIIERNFRCRLAELDLICLQKNNLIFVEVRYRKHSYFGHPVFTINYKKQRKLIQAANLYLQKYKKYINHPCRFDVVSITLDNELPIIHWIRNAFSVV